MGGSDLRDHSEAACQVQRFASGVVDGASAMVVRTGRSSKGSSAVAEGTFGPTRRRVDSRRCSGTCPVDHAVGVTLDMPLSRRRLLLIGAAAPIASLLAPAATMAAAAERRSAILRRPMASGTSATRCAACGAADHAMLQSRLSGAAEGPADDPLPPDLPQGDRCGRRRRGGHDTPRPAEPDASRARLRRHEEPAGRSRGADHLLPQLHRQLRPAGVRARRRPRQGAAGRRLPRHRLRTAWLHEGPELHQPGLRRRPDHVAAHPRRRSRVGQLPDGDLGGGARPGRRRAAGDRRSLGLGLRSTCSGRCRAPGTSRRAPTTGPARCWA